MDCKLQHVSKHRLLRLNYEALKHVNSRWGRSRKINPRRSVSRSRSGQWNMKMQAPRSPGKVPPPAATTRGLNLRIRWGEDANLQLIWCEAECMQFGCIAVVAEPDPGLGWATRCCWGVRLWFAEEKEPSRWTHTHTSHFCRWEGRFGSVSDVTLFQLVADVQNLPLSLPHIC